MSIFADKYNLDVTHTGQAVEFSVDGRKVLVVDVTDTDLIDMIRDAAPYGQGD